MLLVISILLEASVAVIAVLAARQGRPYIYGLAFTFIAYVIYDLARFMEWPVEGPLLSGCYRRRPRCRLGAVQEPARQIGRKQPCG
jgi:hypothetical protein